MLLGQIRWAQVSIVFGEILQLSDVRVDGIASSTGVTVVGQHVHLQLFHIRHLFHAEAALSFGPLVL